MFLVYNLTSHGQSAKHLISCRCNFLDIILLENNLGQKLVKKILIIFCGLQYNYLSVEFAPLAKISGYLWSLHCHVDVADLERTSIGWRDIAGRLQLHHDSAKLHPEVASQSRSSPTSNKSWTSSVRLSSSTSGLSVHHLINIRSS